VTGTLLDLAQKVRDAGIASPALLIVGEVTRLHETLRWFNAANGGTAGLAVAGGVISGSVGERPVAIESTEGRQRVRAHAQGRQS